MVSTRMGSKREINNFICLPSLGSSSYLADVGLGHLGLCFQDFS